MLGKKTRKHFLILPSYQIRLVGFLVVLLFVGSILHGFLLYLMTAKTIQEGFLSTHNRLRSTWEILKPAIVLTNGVSFLLLALVIMTFSIFISHRLIGPLFKIAGRLRELADGRLSSSPIKLRHGDEGKILCDAVNSLQKSLKERLEPLHQLNLKLSQNVEPPAQEIREVIEKVLKNVELEKPEK